MKLNIVQNAKRNMIWGLAERIIVTFLPFVVRTLFINILGSEILGLNGLFTSIFNILNIAELGFSNAVIYNMYKPIAENDTDKVCALMKFYKTIYRVIGLTVWGIGLLLIPFLPKLINGSVPDGYNLYVLYIINLFNTGIGYFLFAYKTCLLYVHQRNDIKSRVSVLMNILTSFLQISILLTIKNYYVYVCVIPVITITSNIINAAIATKMYPQYKCRGSLSKDDLKGIKKNVLGLMIGKICMVSRNSFDNIFLSAFLGLTTVAMYNNYYYIMSSIIAILALVHSAINAGVGNRVALNSVEQNHKDFQTVTFLYMWISGWCTVCMLCLYQPFMQLWVGEKLMFPFVIVVQLCCYFYSLTLGDMRSIYSNSSGLFWQGRFYVIVEAILNIVLNYFLGKRFGVRGIIAATNLTILFVNFIWGSLILYKYYFVNMDVKRYFLSHALYACVTAFISVITYSTTRLISLDGFGGLITKGIICLVIPNVCYYFAYRKNQFFSDSLKLVKRIIAR